MRADAGLHPDQARRQIGKSRLDLATRPFLPKYDRTTTWNEFLPISMPTTAIAELRCDMGVLLVFGAPRQLLSLAGLEHGRTIPLADIPLI